ncbi:Quinol monooxygenase YgiN [Mucilaginibacter lappiensis]|uniref:Quinol monooxygenase YgiN n=1 Tax=Mucilaginibacter lappiensis TaxID=354630 RepID=A0ABR6PQV8_9SPHI|nr:antibiotic biosynthesis monooxygenase [Mucilaginibacter lappiensis]MBB6112166.1 quinol monooxygenase YgiN [Mucilaginibacter lappiensis]SIR93393.1 Quinol monooxygenase YgiN [Mucilaginibacter lappiensis]
MNSKITLIANIDILPGFEEEVKNAMVTMAIETRKEAGCELFQVNTREDLPRIIVNYEVYQNQEAFELHKTYNYAATFFDYVKGKIKDDEIEVVYLTALNSY